MFIVTDSLAYASELLPQQAAALLSPAGTTRPAIARLADAMLAPAGRWCAGPVHDSGWPYLLLCGDAPQSQCDLLLELARDGHDIPDRTLCVARAGPRFHGFKGRPWSAEPGNIHLAVHFAPHRGIERFEVAFTILAAVSVLDAIDALAVPGLRAGVRWVNDIVVGEAKLGGVLAYTQTQHRTVTTAILGIGLNVLATPQVAPTAFVPAVTSLREHGAGAGTRTLQAVFASLLSALDGNYRLLLEAGYRPLLDRYRERSTILGRHCTVCTDESDADVEAETEGVVESIGDGLELHLRGLGRPVTGGRLMVGSAAQGRLPARRAVRMPETADREETHRPHGDTACP